MASTVGDKTKGQLASGMMLDSMGELHSKPGSTAGLARHRQNNGSAPLSFAQERLWFLDQINSGDISANISRGIRIRGALKIELLRQSLQAVVDRHESLRTTFATTQLYAGVDSKPVQLVANSRNVQVSFVDFSSAPSEQHEVKARNLARAEAQRPFDLALGPLLRATLLILDEHDHVLLLNLHRIVCDESSLDILLSDLWEFYSAGLAGRPLEVPQLSIQYADYASWQRKESENDAFETHREWWKEKLDAAPAAIELPADRHRPAIRSWRGESVSFPIEAGLSQSLRALSEHENTSLFMTLVAAFQILISRYTGQKDIVVGSGWENRDVDETRALIGAFRNTLPLRTDLSGNPTFRDFLARVKAVKLAADEHRAMPFEKIVEELPLERSLNSTPVFQVTFTLSERSASGLVMEGLRIEEFKFESGIARYDLSLDMIDSGHQLTGSFVYKSDLFDRETIERMSGHFVPLLEGIVRNPDQRIGELPLLNEAEHYRIVTEWNDTKTDSQQRSFRDLFELQVRRAPQAPAIVFEGEALNYGELNLRANQVAHHLQKHGVGPETIVGICLPRSVNMVVGLLGIVKAGAAYLPLDPHYPRERLVFMLKDAGASVLLSHSSLRDKLPADLNPIWIDIESLAAEPVSDPLNTAGPDNLVYVIYTSGSTGTPKGVMVTHKGLANHLSWATSLCLSQEGGSLVHSPLAFDLTVTSLLVPLVSGHCVTLVREEDSLQSLAEGIRNMDGRGLLKMTPSHIEGLSFLLTPEDVRSTVGCVVIGGEVLRAEALSFWRKAAPGGRLINEYGPTETVVGCCVHEVTSKDDWSGPLPIGRPIINTQLYLLNEFLQPVPVGVTGELYIGGAGVARGYLNRPELTAERFLPDRFSGIEGERLYRTGDLARYLPDGNLFFLGRADDQVKVRGYRIELGEIEKSLSEYPGIKQACVIVHEDPEAGKRLVAYVVTENRNGSVVSDLRSFLESKLPDYMVPSVIVILEELPLTTNGKIDRQALSRNVLSRPDSEDQYVGPRDELEEQLVIIWEKVLGLSQIGVNDNFFELGGHSLLAVRLFAQIENRFRSKISLASLFQAPTIEKLANVLRKQRGSDSWSSLVAIQPAGSKPPLFCVHAAGANVLIYRPMSRHLGTDQPLYALQARGLDGASQPYSKVEEMAAHYIKEMRTVQSEGPYYLLGASFGGLVVFEMAHQLLEAGQRVALLAMLNTNCPIYSLAQRIRCHIGHLGQLGPRGYLRAASQRVGGRIGKTFSAGNYAVDKDLQAVIETQVDLNDPLVRTIMATLHASETYLPLGKIYPGKVTLFWAADAASDFEDNRLGWRRLATGGLEVHVVPGDHTTIREEPNVGLLVDKLKDCLERARAQEAALKS